MKKLLCVVITVMIVMSVCTTVGAETSEQRVERIYPNWKEDYEQWNNKGLVDGYDINMRALVVGVVEHRLASFNIIDILLYQNDITYQNIK